MYLYCYCVVFLEFDVLYVGSGYYCQVGLFVYWVEKCFGCVEMLVVLGSLWLVVEVFFLYCIDMVGVGYVGYFYVCGGLDDCIVQGVVGWVYVDFQWFVGIVLL